MFRVKFFSRWNGYSNEYEHKDFDKLEDAEAFAAGCYDATIYKRIPSGFPNSKWEYVAINKEVR